MQLSVVIPFYQVEKYIGACLDALAALPAEESEILLVDDCGRDGSAAIAAAYCAAHPNARVIRRAQNGGLSAARNTGLDAAQGDVSIAVEKLENGEKSAFSYKIGARGADGAHTETAAFGTQSISCDWQPKTGDMVLTLPGKSPISLNLSQAQDGFQIQTKDFAALIGINSQKGFDSTMTVRKGSAITTPKYKNLDEWSLDDLLVLLGSIGGLLGFK